MRRIGMVGGLAAALLVAGAGTALAGIGDGNYNPEDQRCTGHADDHSHEDEVEEGCQTVALYVGDQSGGEAVRVGYQQTPEGEFVHLTEPEVTTGEADPSSGARVYFGADDNLDNGEHDSSEAIGDGPSDGGAIQFNVTPESAEAWAAALQAGDSAYLLTHPLPFVDAGTGACADGVCFAVQTQQRLAYDGGATADDDETDTTADEPDRDVADYEGHEWDPESCAGPSDTEEDCGPGGISTWHENYGDTYVEPGVQVYEDPSPEGSPLGPYPLPAAYAGTCGVILGGGAAPAVPASPVTNGAGQVDIATGC